GKPLISPNDLIVDARGGIYFTDPGPRPIVPGRPTNVYYLPAGAKEPILIDDQNPRPGGIFAIAPGASSTWWSRRAFSQPSQNAQSDISELWLVGRPDSGSG